MTRHLRPILAGYALIVIFGAGFGGWAALTPIAGAVLAMGTLAPESGQRAIQHPDGGRIADVRVAEGAVVAKGALLLRLDGGEVRSEIARLEAQLAQTEAEATRLAAERDDAGKLAFPTGKDGLKPHQQAQARFFTERRAAHLAQLGQIARRIDQIREQSAGLAAGLGATRRQLTLWQATRDRAADLAARGLLPAARLEETERELARLEGQLGTQIAARAEAESRIAEAELEALRLQAARRESAAADLRAVLAEADDLRERLNGLEARRDAFDLRAPVAGTVIGIRSAASVLRPGEAAAYLIPSEGPLVVEARIGLTDRDAVEPGQAVSLRLSGFNIRQMADIPGRLTLVSAGALQAAETTVQTPAAQGAYYSARIEVFPDDIDPVTAGRLVAGMPVQVMITTRMRTALSYLTDPLTGYFRRAFREG